jgi:glycosyltransferase involved in cell wall biosynthesis
MNIALYNLTTTTKHGGVESIVWETAQHLARRGHMVTLFGGDGPVSRPVPGIRVLRYPYVARERWGRAAVLRKSLNLLKLLERLSMATRALPDLLTGRFDIVQVVKPYDFPVAALARARTGARFIYNSHGTDFFPGDRLFRRAIDGAIACSRFNAAAVEARYHIPIGVAYNGFDDTLFRPLPPDRTLRERFAPDGAPLIVYAGRLVTFKGIDHLLDARAILSGWLEHQCLVAGGWRLVDDLPPAASRQPPAASSSPHLLLVGEGPHRASLERRAAELGIADRVHFMGARPHAELPGIYALADVFVVPSTDHETFCIAACEAMACERPVVGSRVGGVPEVVRDGETGFLVPPGDAHALAERIATLLGDDALRGRMGQAGRAWTQQMFTWDRVIERMLACYEQALLTASS